jgi:hypothetical protein
MTLTAVLEYRPLTLFLYRTQYKREPLWQPKDFSALKRLLNCQSAARLPLSRLIALWENYLGSNETFTARQAGSLAYFCGAIDKFADGPLSALFGKGENRGHAKLTGEDLTQATLTDPRPNGVCALARR